MVGLKIRHRWSDNLVFGEPFLDKIAAMFLTLLAACMIDQDKTHRLGCSRIEVPTPFPFSPRFEVDQPCGASLGGAAPHTPCARFGWPLWDRLRNQKNRTFDTSDIAPNYAQIATPV